MSVDLSLDLSAVLFSAGFFLVNGLFAATTLAFGLAALLDSVPATRLVLAVFLAAVFLAAIFFAAAFF
ncbi:uncharacterized protein METZ01_LOCUS299262, partial [marine metagenome]